MWQKKAIEEDIITTQICKNFFIPMKNFLCLDKTQAWGVFECFSFQKPKNSLQIATIHL